MWTLSTFLPLMIGDKIRSDDPFWECYLCLLQITKYCTARIVSPGLSDYLAVLIERHHRGFRRCYPEQNMTPKLHYMLHFPRLMKV